MPPYISPAILNRLSAEAERRDVSIDMLLGSWLNAADDVRDMYALTDANPDLIARFNRQLQYTYVNPSSVQILARPVEDILGYTLYDMPMKRELADYLSEQIRLVFNTARRHWCEYQLQGRRKIYTYEVQMIPVLGRNGQVESVLTVSRDITRRIAAEAALRDSERRYRIIVEGQIDLVCLYYPNTSVAFVNDAYCEYFGKSREQIIGTSFIALTDPIEREQIAHRLQEVIRDPSPKLQEYRMSNADGSTRWISWVDHGITDETGNVVMIQAIGRDITHMKLIEQQLEIERERYELLFNENPLPLMVYDTETLSYLAVNDSALSAYGYTREEMLGMSMLDIRPEEDIPKIKAFLASHVAAADRDEIDLGIWRHRHKDGTVFDVEVTGRGIIFNGRPARLTMALNITERRALESERLYTQSLEIELQKEREMTLLKERFTSMVTHEFRTPLSVIVSTIDILKNYMHRLTQENMAHKLDIVTSEAKRMSALLDDVLTLSRATAGRIRVSPEPLNLLEVMQGLFENFRLADHNQHLFNLVAGCEDIMIVTDRRLLEQVLINLLANAVKYSPDGTTITAEVQTNEHRVTLMVSDQGRGIPEADQPRIFEAFHRADNAEGIEGTGLGLAIVKESVSVLGGDIKFKSRIGVGTTFTVDLPISLS